MRADVTLRLGNSLQNISIAGQRWGYSSGTSTISASSPGGGGGGFGVVAPNLPAGWTVICQTGLIKPTNPGYVLGTSGTINFGGPVPFAWTRNGGDTTNIGFAGAALNPDGTTNTDIQSSGYRVPFLVGKVNDPAWNMFGNHVGGTGSYYIGWAQRWTNVGGYGNVLSRLNSQDSKTYSPKGAGDWTIMSFLSGVTQNASSPPSIGSNFQGVDSKNIPDNNQTGSTNGTTPVIAAMKLPALAINSGGYDHMEMKVICVGGNQATSNLTMYVNGAQVGPVVTNVTNATVWNATEEYLSRSIYNGTQSGLIYTDKDNVTFAVN